MVRREATYNKKIRATELGAYEVNLSLVEDYVRRLKETWAENVQANAAGNQIASNV